MEKRTLHNVEKAVALIMQKGYCHKEANKIALQCFDNKEADKNGMSVEWYISKIAPYEEWVKETKMHSKKEVTNNQQSI